MITPELIKQALDTASDTCKESCIHADAVKALQQQLESEVAKWTLACMTLGVNPAMGIFDMGLHVGYRLRQLETDTTPLPKGQVN